MSAVVRDGFVRFNGVHYFRGNATAVALGGYGRIRNPALTMDFLEVDGNLDIRSLAVLPAVLADIDTTASSKIDVEAGLKLSGAPVTGGAKSGFEAFKQGAYKLVQFTLASSDVRAAINSNADARADLTSIGLKARVAHQIWIVMAAQEADRFSGNVSLTASFKDKQLDITAHTSGSTSTSRTVTVSAGSTYAYLLLRPLFGPDGNVVSMTTDQWGIG